MEQPDHTTISPPPMPHGLTRPQLLELYYYMRLTRSLEERIVRLKRQGKVVGNVYRSLGQEADAVGTAFALERDDGDILCPLIRNLGSLLVRGATATELLRQHLATATSPAAGKDVFIHFSDLHRGFIQHISSLGAMVSVMAGVALSFKQRAERRVAMVYSGDGATSTGAFHEGLNLAAVLRVPLVVVVESNHYAYSTPSQLQFAVQDLSTRAKAYGVTAAAADGNDVLEVYGVTRAAVDRARNDGGVTMLVLDTYRRLGHANHDDQRYVPSAELAHWETLDPLIRYAVRLTAETGWFQGSDLVAVDQRVDREIEEAFEQCADDPMPAGDEALADVWSSTPLEQLWFRDLAATSSQPPARE
jgi:TPP-dependent pyruvate/acetoin dehydrogenase alpha subunit